MDDGEAEELVEDLVEDLIEDADDLVQEDNEDEDDDSSEDEDAREEDELEEVASTVEAGRHYRPRGDRSDKRDSSTAAEVFDAKRTTEARLTKYECISILGVRAQQLSLGAPACIPLPEGKPPDALTPLAIAVLELKAGRTPLVLRRPLPCGGTDRWRVCELVRTPEDLPPIVYSTVPYYR